ncbi:hypothetical protein TEA_029940 [Camellia sinensis var. sinensis]|uniref:Uncharacterized protein n=1 Tax=Camellia sinensis var. sinensis TaxID=542762 RepID=A0A4S4EZF4_CAMSN|nr:hypothetical protein TEA_029940 [Camellia sinensis var. sinensis]
MVPGPLNLESLHIHCMNLRVTKGFPACNGTPSSFEPLSDLPLPIHIRPNRRYIWHMDGQRSYLSNLVLVLLPSGSSISNSPIASCSLSVIPAHGETGVVEERFRLNAKRRREYTGSLESTSSSYLPIFKVQFTEETIQIGGKQPCGLFLATISLLLTPPNHPKRNGTVASSVFHQGLFIFRVDGCVKGARHYLVFGDLRVTSETSSNDS